MESDYGLHLIRLIYFKVALSPSVLQDYLQDILKMEKSLCGVHLWVDYEIFKTIFGRRFER